MSQFLTVKEAAKMIGKSPSAVRRIIYPILEAELDPDRIHIQPPPDEVQALRMKGEVFSWRISEEFLRTKVAPDSGTEKGNATRGSREATGNQLELITMLREELAIKNQQISQQSQMLSQQMELISGLSERLREGNVLIGTLQQQFRLGDASQPAKSDIVDAKSAMQEPKPASPKPSSPKPAAKPVKPKRGFLGRLFH